MKLRELYTHLALILERHPDEEDADVVIHTARPCVPTNQLAGLASLSLGFDWTKGKCVLRPDISLVPQRVLGYTRRQMAGQALKRQEDIHTKTGFKYLPNKAHRESWILGYIEALREQFTDSKSVFQ